MGSEMCIRDRYNAKGKGDLVVGPANGGYALRRLLDSGLTESVLDGDGESGRVRVVCRGDRLVAGRFFGRAGGDAE